MKSLAVNSAVAQAEVGGKGFKVLLFEEDPVMFSVIHDFVSETHPKFSIVNSDTSGMSRSNLHKEAERLQADLVVYDLNDVRLENNEVKSSLRFLASRFPLVLITPFGADDTRRKAHCLGAVAYLSKPFKLADFCREVSAVVKSHAPQEFFAKI